MARKTKFTHAMSHENAKDLVESSEGTIVPSPSTAVLDNPEQFAMGETSQFPWKRTEPTANTPVHKLQAEYERQMARHAEDRAETEEYNSKEIEERWGHKPGSPEHSKILSGWMADYDEDMEPKGFPASGDDIAKMRGGMEVDTSDYAGNRKYPAHPLTAPTDRGDDPNRRPIYRV